MGEMNLSCVFFLFVIVLFFYIYTLLSKTGYLGQQTWSLNTCLLYSFCRPFCGAMDFAWPRQAVS